MNGEEIVVKITATNNLLTVSKVIVKSCISVIII